MARARYCVSNKSAGASELLRFALASPIKIIFDAAWQESEIGSSIRILEGFLSLTIVFGSDLPERESFRHEVAKWLDHLHRHGAIAAVRATDDR